MEERKFVCKYCSKRFPCGKSLGGHIRTHMSDSHQANQERSNNNNNNNNAAMFNKLDASGRKRKRDLGSSGGVDDDGNGNMIYGLRENPKKTTRFVHSNNSNNAAAAAATTSVQMEKFCKECGKGFPSLKALCGHMACHSEKDKGRFENNNSSGLSEKNQQKLVMDSQSDTETNSVPRRSKRMKFKNLSNNNNNNYNPHLPPPPSSSSLPPNGSSSVSEVEQEQEEVARCLMLLSKDSSYYYRGTTTRFALVTESSDNNSVVLEAKSPSVDTRVTVNYGTKKNSVYSNANYELVEGKKKKLMILKDEKLKKSSAEIGGYASDNSDSGYFRYGPKKVVDSGDDDDSSDDGFFRNEVKSSKVGYLSGFEDHHHDDVESRKMLSSRGRSRNYGKDGGSMRRIDSRNKTANGFNNDGIYEHGGGGKGSWKYECLTSERDNVIGSDDSAYESDENSTDTDTYPAPKAHNNNNSRSISGKKKSSSKGKNKKLLKSKKSKEHECPICNKIFRSGQALGGHKRSHFVGGSEENTLVIRPGAPPPVPCLIDLNLPAPVDE